MSALRGRGTGHNPKNRFEATELLLDQAAGPVKTRFYRDDSRTILSKNNSPDIPFDLSLNPYRGCEHGCAYCYARQYHEFAGFSCGLDFESKIMVKEKAPELLRRELMHRHWRPQVIALSGATDCYQPVERSLRLTRGCLEVLHEFRNPVSIVTKNGLVSRDLDLLSGLAEVGAAVVSLSITTLDGELASKLEPRAASPRRRLRTISELAEGGVPVGVMVAPVIPGLNDHEVPEILAAARGAGARFACYQSLRLPHGVAGLFDRWLEEHLPDQRKKILRRVESLHGGELGDPGCGVRMRGLGPFAEEIRDLFRLSRSRAGFSDEEGVALSAASFRRPGPRQGQLF